MEFKNTEVWGLKHALRGMRNPMNSWAKGDSRLCDAPLCRYCDEMNCKGQDTGVVIGASDLTLAQKLIRSGSEHRKFMRQIFVSVDITAPLYWWKEFDTYKIGTVANSTSTMHKITSQPITLDCFETGDYTYLIDTNDERGFTDDEKKLLQGSVEQIIQCLETLRQRYVETKNEYYWKELIRWLPESWLQTRTVTMNYENIFSMVHQRKGHKLLEWAQDFIGWTQTLPYADELLFIDGTRTAGEQDKWR